MVNVMKISSYGVMCQAYFNVDIYPEIRVVQEHNGYQDPKSTSNQVILEWLSKERQINILVINCRIFTI